MQKNNYKRIKKDSGNAMLITTILLLVMTVLVGACMNIAGMQFDLAVLQRNTSNTYYLAQSGLEKEVDMINKAIQTEMANTLQKIRVDYLKKITTFLDETEKGNTASSSTSAKYEDITYVAGKLQIKDTKLKESLKNYSYTFIKENFLDKEFSYTVKSDRQQSTTNTQVVVKAVSINQEAPLDTTISKKDSFKITATATTKEGTNILDTQTVEAIININLPNPIDHEIREKYEWVGNPPEILDSAITCFSDMVVTNGAKLTVNGDIRVKGSKKLTTSGYWPEADESGGVIVSNRGELNVNKRTTKLDGTTDLDDTTGNIYCMNNVVTTNGWDGTTGHYNESSTIDVTGDIIANTVGIFDDFYSAGGNQSPFGPNADEGYKVRKNSIRVTNNIFVDNDVRIDKWVATESTQSKKTRIEVGGSIFGISNSSIGVSGNVDPNASSCVLNEGNNTLIKAKQMFVYGQPFITLTEGGKPIRLHESIGEPYNAIRGLPAYNLPDSDPSYYFGDESYLLPTLITSFIKTDKIEIEDISRSYSTAYTSATTGVGASKAPLIIKNNHGILDQTTAGELFSTGGYVPSTISDFVTEVNDFGRNKKFNIIQKPTDYYNGAIFLFNQSSMYKKFYAPPDSVNNKWQGLKGYMTAMRSVFYGIFDSGTPSAPKELGFSDVVELSELSTLFSSNIKSWSYSNPIEVVTGEKTLEIDKYYVKDDEVKPGDTERPYPTIILNTSTEKLTIKTSGKNIFKGVIISNGDVEIQGEINIEGAIIIKGKNEGNLPKDRRYIMLGEDTEGITGEQPYSPGLKLSNGAVVTILQNADILLAMDFADRSYLREVMDALKITQYKGKTNVGEILGPYNYPLGSLDPYISYTMGRLVLSKDSILDIKTNKVDISIKSMKKIND